MNNKKKSCFVDATKSPNPTHPSDVLKDELEAREINVEDFAKKIGVQTDMLTDLLNGKVSFTPEIAVKIEDVLTIPAQFWLKMQTTYQIATLRNQMKKEVKQSNISSSKKEELYKSL